MCSLLRNPGVVGFAIALLISQVALSAAPPLSLSFGEHGQTIVSIQHADRSFLLETSHDLQTWEVFRQGKALDNPAAFEDWVPNELRFYRLRLCDRPDNDAFDQATKLRGENWSIEVPIFEPTLESGEPAHASAQEAAGSVWFSWNAPVDGVLTINSVGSYFDTIIAVYEGTKFDALKRVSQLPTHTRSERLFARKGTEYHIAIATLNPHGGLLRLSGSLAGLPDISTLPVDNFSVTINPYHREQRELKVQNGEVRGMLLKGLPEDLKKQRAAISLKTRNKDQQMECEFLFTHPGSGIYSIREGNNSDPIEQGSFHGWKALDSPLALESLAGAQMVGTRTWTTTGPVGQSHYYTFTENGRFHDTDNDEQAAGTYNYERLSDTSAKLILDYKGPGDFTGDRHELLLTFQTARSGTFESDYRRNDATRIVIKGDFEILDE
jgi:hypothetical protein